MGSLLDKLFPADSVKDVQKKMMEYGRKNPDKSEAEIVKMFSGYMSRAKKAEAKQKLKDMPLPKSKQTKKQRKKAADDANEEAWLTSMEKAASKELKGEQT